MNKKIKNTSSKIVASVASKQHLTPLQTVVIGFLMTTFLLISISSMVTYSSNKKPSKHIFSNSQTIRVLNQ